MATAWNFWQVEKLGEGDWPGDSPDYSEWSKAQLAAELAARGLPKSGTKDELIARLVEDDG